MKQSVNYRRVLKLFESGDFLPIFVLIAAIQGTVLISQSLSATFLTPQEIGQIRSFESVISIGILLTGFGAPALAIREIAAQDNDRMRGNVLRDLTVLPFFGTVLFSIFACIVSLFPIEWLREARETLVSVAALLLAANLVRLSSAISQGLLIVSNVYRWVLLGASIGTIIQIAMATKADLSWWIWGRFVSELVLLMCILIGMRSHLSNLKLARGLNLKAVLVIMGPATMVNIGLLLRMLADAAPILLLGGFLTAAIPGGTAEDVGYFGIATLFLSAAQFGPAIISQRNLPLLVAAKGMERSRRAARFCKTMWYSGCGIAIAGATLAQMFMELDDGRISEGLLVSSIIMLSVPIKSLATAFGTCMLSKGDYKSPIWVTLFELIIIVLLFKINVGLSSLHAAAFAVILGSIFSAAGLYIADRWNKFHGSHNFSAEH